MLTVTDVRSGDLVAWSYRVDGEPYRRQTLVRRLAPWLNGDER